MSSNVEDLLRMFLDCGSLDLSVLDGIEYDLCEIVEELYADGIRPTLNAITDAVFRIGQMELAGAVAEAISRRKEKLYEMDEIPVPDPDPESAEHERYVLIQGEIEELELLNPEEDMGWYCNYLDTSCWIDEYESIYRKYLADEISEIEDKMGFEF